MNLNFHISLRIESLPALTSFVNEIFMNDILTLLITVKETMIIVTEPVQIVNVHWSTHAGLNHDRNKEEQEIHKEGVFDLKESNVDLVDQEIES